jgi:hypothetical protein
MSILKTFSFILVGLAATVCQAEIGIAVVPPASPLEHPAASSETTPSEIELKVEPLRLAIELVDGSHLIGVPSITSVPIQTSYARMDIPLEKIASIEIEADHETAAIALQNGDKLEGVLDLKPLELETIFGRITVDVQQAELVSIITGMIPLRGLVLHYSFDTDGGTRAVDASEKQNDGTIHGAKHTPRGKAGGAYEFDGVDDRIEVPYKASLFSGKEFTLCAWIYRYATGAPHNIISSTYNNPPDTYMYLLQTTPEDQLALHSYRRGPILKALSDSGLKSRRWYFVCGTYDSGLEAKNAKVYMDGKLEGTANYRALLGGYNGPLNIGCYQNRAGGARYRGHFNGMIDEVMIFDRALSDSEIRMIYNSQK